MTDPHRDTAANFLTLVTKGNIRDEYEKYTALATIHHNVYFKGDRESLLKAMEENHNMFPDKLYEVKRVLEDGDIVAVHGRVQLDKEKNIAVVHIMRFENEKIVEMWDVGQEIPKDSPNENGIF